MNKLRFDPQPILDSLPKLPGVYRYYNKDEVLLYVGKARQLKSRVSSYFQKTDLSPRIRLMISQIARLEITVTRSESEALLLENNLIKSLKPRYNILFRDDKSYPYMVLTQEEFPRLMYYRGAPVGPHHYFGPYPNATAVRDGMHLLQNIFQLRTCEDNVFKNRTRPCLLHQLNRCSAPCVKKITPSDYQNDVQQVKWSLQGKYGEVETSLQEAMDEASESQYYERAALARNRLRALHSLQQKQFVESTGGVVEADVLALAQQEGLVCVNRVMIRGGRHLGDQSFFPVQAEGWGAENIMESFVVQHYVGRTVPPLLVLAGDPPMEPLEQLLSEQAGHPIKIGPAKSEDQRQWLFMAEKNAGLALGQRLAQQGGQKLRLERLREFLEMPDLKRIECFDVSHTMGEAAQASCVVYENLDMRPSQYRRYNIKEITPGDDYAALRQTLTRRYQKSAALPDLVLIDGGPGQLHIAMEVLRDLGLNDLALVGVAKGKERKAGMEQLVFPAGTVKRLGQDDPALHLIQNIRDEAHRFAITGHRAKRGKIRTASSLEEIPGVGAKRRRSLLAHFGGLREVSRASIEQLCQVKGISRALAEKIHAQLGGQGESALGESAIQGRGEK